jgi:Amino acid synthesis
MAVIRNPFAGQFVEVLRPLFEAGAMLGERLMPELVKLLDGPASPTAKARSSELRAKWGTAVVLSASDAR